MIFDHRTYTIRPNRLARFLDTYERLALSLQRKYLGEPYGFFVTCIGALSRVVHQAILVDMENLILKPVPFFQPRSVTNQELAFSDCIVDPDGTTSVYRNGPFHGARLRPTNVRYPSDIGD